MWLPLIGLLLGLVVGSILNRMPSANVVGPHGAPLGGVLSGVIPIEYTRYTAIAILAAMDSVLGALRADIEDQYDNLVFISGFLINSLLAVLLTLLGDRLGIELEYAAIVAFGVRMFANLATIRRRLLANVREWWHKQRTGQGST
jgi:small basic protein